MIKRHKIVEQTSNEFAPEDQVDSTYLDLGVLEEEKRAKLERENEKLRREQAIEDGSGAGDRFEIGDEETETTVRAKKKKEARDK